MSGRQDIYALCPFYRRAEKQKVICEGLVENSTVHMAFATSTEMDAYKREYCDKAYRMCLWEQTLEKRYEQVSK